MEIVKNIFATVGAIGVANWILRLWRRKRQKQKEKSEQLHFGTMDLILVIVGVSILAFVLKMIHLFETYMTVPDTLITCFFAFCGGECGVMGMIKTNKDRNRERNWQLEDMERMKKEAKDTDI